MFIINKINTLIQTCTRNELIWVNTGHYVGNVNINNYIILYLTNRIQETQQTNQEQDQKMIVMNCLINNDCYY